MSNERETILAVDGMTCSSCVRHVTAALRELRGIRDVAVELRQGKVRVMLEAGAASTAEMIAALGEAAYESHIDGVEG